MGELFQNLEKPGGGTIWEDSNFTLLNFLSPDGLWPVNYLQNFRGEFGGHRKD